MSRVTPNRSAFSLSFKGLWGATVSLVVTLGCGGVPSDAAVKAPTRAPRSVPLHSKIWLVESFESDQGLSGGYHCEFDRNGLGTQVSPDPFVRGRDGAPPSAGGAARYVGALGDNRPPYSWAQLQVFLDRAKGPRDLRQYRSIRFWVKGDGRRYSVALAKQAVTDFDHFKQEFVAQSGWSQVVLPLDRFVQAGWGRKAPPVFDDVVQIQFSPAAFSQPFDLSVDHIELATDVVLLTPVAYQTESWFSYGGTDPSKRRGTALDVSRLLDAPAGKYGPLKRQGESFVFANGKAIRFWGVNLVASANFPSHEEADKLAELLAQMGVNMTRHHHLDAPWSTPNLFGNRQSSLELDEAALERFDYLIAALQRRGIYQFFDLLANRKAYAADAVRAIEDVANGYKIEGQFDARLLELQEAFIEQFLGRRNPYTKRTYAKDPAVALVEVINEDSLFWIQKEGDFAVTSPVYKQALAQLFSTWLQKKLPGGRAALESRWQPGAAGGNGLTAGEDPAAGNVDAHVTFANDDPKRLSKARAMDTFRFYYETSLGYYRRIQAKLKQLGFQGLVAGSNHWVETPIDLHLNAQLDFLDRHSYWSHPEGGWGYRREVSWNPGSMLKDAGLGVVGSIGSRRVKGLPYSASEWQTSAPNDYRHEGVLVVGAYAALANWSPLQFAFSHDARNRSDAIPLLSSNFDVIEQPAMLAAWPAVSLLFHRRDVAESKREAVLRVDDADLFDPLFRGSVPKELARLGKTGFGFGLGLGQGASFDELTQLVSSQIKQGVAVANDGELVHDANQGTLLVNTARSQAFAGFKPNQKVSLANVELELDSAFAVVIVSSLDDQPLSSSRRILVTALGNSVNSGMLLEPSRNRIRQAGSSPILVEPILGRLTLRALTGVGELTVHALGPSGERERAVAINHSEGGLVLKLAAEHRTMHYEIVRD